MPTSEDSTARDRIRDAALDRFGRDGVNRVTVRAIAADAGVSPALVVHHFGSKEGLRRACDAHLVAMIRTNDDTAAGEVTGLSAMLEAATPARRYLARAFLDGSPDAAALFDEIVDVTTTWLTEGVRAGWAQPTESPRARAAIYVSWLLAPLTLSDHLERVLGVDDLFETDTTVEYAQVLIEMLTRGVFADESTLDTWAELDKERKNR